MSDSVDPTIRNGSTVLVDHQHDELMHDCIFAVRPGSVVLVKRTVDEDRDWKLVSDNTKYKPLDLPEDSQVLGKVR